MLANGFRYGTEDNTGLGQFLLEGRDNRHTVEHRIHGHLAGRIGWTTAFFIKRAGFIMLAHASQKLLLLQRDTEFFVGTQQFRINLIKALGTGLPLWCGVKVDILEIDLRIADLRPVRFVHLQPAGIGVETLLQHPFRLFLLDGNEPDHIFRQPLGSRVGFNNGFKAILVLVDVNFLDAFNRFNIGHSSLSLPAIRSGSCCTCHMARSNFLPAV